MNLFLKIFRTSMMYTSHMAQQLFQRFGLTTNLSPPSFNHFQTTPLLLLSAPKLSVFKLQSNFCLQLFKPSCTYLSSLIPVLAQEWISVDGSYCTIAALTLFWLYLFALVTSRLTLIRKSYYSRAGLWYHSTVLYALAWVFSLPAFRSALIHPYSHVSKLFHFIQFFNITVLVINNFSSKMGDNPAQALQDQWY